jgi:hypothetical protein
MQINYLAALVCAVIAMFVGFLWYGPIFGKKWLEITGANNVDAERRKEMMKGVWKLYITQFLLALFQIIVLAFYIKGWTDASGLENALWIWAAFVMPTVAAASMWNNDSAKVSWARFLLQAGYQLVIFAIFGLVLGLWK